MNNISKLISKDTVIVFDLETTGFVPGINSILSIGAVAYQNGLEVSNFYAALKEFEGSECNEGCVQWWRDHREAWQSLRQIAEEPKEVMQRFYNWMLDLPKPHTLAANPSAMDAGLLFWYLHVYCGENAVERLVKRHRCFDIRTAISVLFAVPYSEAERYIAPSEWSEGLVITHNALDDAREQGTMLMNLLRASVGELEMNLEAVGA